MAGPGGVIGLTDVTQDKGDNGGRPRQLWYVRRGEAVEGPFPPGLVARFAILGRIRMSDELSRDLQSWAPLEQLPELIPEVLRADTDDPLARQRLMAARRWEDERNHSGDRRTGRWVSAHDRRAGSERRQAETGEEVRRPGVHDELVERISRRRRYRLMSAVIALGVFAGLTSLVFLYKPSESRSAIDCGRPPAPGVNWDNCLMEGRVFTDANLIGAHMKNMNLSRADLSGSQLVNADLSFTVMSVADLRDADLRAARLVGTSLRGADLTGANLAQADLSYANLRGARLEGANLEEVELRNAVWIDGQVCAAGSVGRCVPVQE